MTSKQKLNSIVFIIVFIGYMLSLNWIRDNISYGFANFIYVSSLILFFIGVVNSQNNNNN